VAKEGAGGEVLIFIILVISRLLFHILIYLYNLYLIFPITIYLSYFMPGIKLKIKKFNKDIESVLPVFKTEHSSGMDLASASQTPIAIQPFETKIIPTNWVIEIPPGFEGQVRPRSGLALKNQITVLNTPGTIDADYRGEVKVLLINLGKEPFIVNFGDRIAQLIISGYEKVELEISETLTGTERSEGGYGSTGVN
jgi:dUTP pyrophosphatase